MPRLFMSKHFPQITTVYHLVTGRAFYEVLGFVLGIASDATAFNSREIVHWYT